MFSVYLLGIILFLDTQNHLWKFGFNWSKKLQENNETNNTRFI